METKLGEVVDVIRCQLPRQRIGERKGWLLCWEATQADFGAVSGLVDDVSGKAWVELDPGGKQQKYLVRNNDVLFSFRGTGGKEGTLGQVGLYVGKDGKNVVCGQSICIIRSKTIDPLWLYYFMRSDDIRENLLAKACGSRLMTINLNDLRDILIKMPCDEEIDKIHEKHSRVLSIYNEIRTLNSEMADLMK